MTRTVIVAALLLGGCGGGGQTPTPLPTPSAGPVVGVSVANEGWLHVAEGSSVEYRNNPPASGPHYPVWLRYEAYSTAMARPYWVHNLEHGAIVLVYRPDATAATRDALATAYDAIPPDPLCGHKRAVLTPDPLLDRPFAVIAADWLLEADAVDAAQIQAFVSQHRGHGPEQVCDQGQRP